MSSEPGEAASSPTPSIENLSYKSIVDFGLTIEVIGRMCSRGFVFHGLFDDPETGETTCKIAVDPESPAGRYIKANPEPDMVNRFKLDVVKFEDEEFRAHYPELFS